MRITLAQLKKYALPYKFSEDLDLSEDLNDFEDILSSTPVHINGVISEAGFNKYEVVLELSVVLTLQCAITLEEVPYKIETKTTEIYAYSEESTMSSDYFPFDGVTLDIKEAVLTSIICQKPMRIVKEGATFKNEGSVAPKEEKEKINPAFASLKDLL